jgi:cysteine desulfurase
MRKIYLDNAATTPVDKRVLKEMHRYWAVDFGNPSSIHSVGVTAKAALQKARKTIADFLHAHDREIIFTSGGTEANNIAIFGLEKQNNFVPHFITTEVEHSSILESFKELEKMGYLVNYLPVDENGLVNPKDLREIIRPETVLISIGYANSEIGTIEPVKEIIKEIRHKRKEFAEMKKGNQYFHLDASQAAQYLNMNVEELGVDLMTLDAQKIYGPKGIGALYIRDGVIINPTLFGGGQEKGLRSGTENIPLIVGLAKAVELVEKMREKEIVRLTKIRDVFFDGVKKYIPQAIINGDTKNRLPNNINISIPEEDGEMMVLRLDEAEMICSSASACASGSGESYVVRKIAEKSGMLEKEIDPAQVNLRAKSTLRFSLGRETKIADIKKLLKIIQKIVVKNK